MDANLYGQRDSGLARQVYLSSTTSHRRPWWTPTIGILLSCLFVCANTGRSSSFLSCGFAFVRTTPARSLSIISTTITTKTLSRTTIPTITSRLWRQPTKWDLILDEEDMKEDADKDETALGPRQYSPCPPDMMYEPRIVQRCHQTFLAIRQAGGKEVTNDVYVRDPVDKEVLWYTGKVARVSDVSLEECIHRLYPMIERHACHLRPKELYPFRGIGGGRRGDDGDDNSHDGASVLEVWTAPGDSELEVAYNRPTLQMQRFVHTKEWQYTQSKKENSSRQKYPIHVKASMVGFQGEVYQDGEDGFRTWRRDDGLPARPELNPGGESRPPTETELMQLQNELQPQTRVSSSTISPGRKVSEGNFIDAVITQDVASNANSDNVSS